MQARRAVGRSAATGEPVKGMGALLRDHPRVANSSYAAAYRKKMEGPRAALNAWREQTGGVTGSYTQRTTAIKEYFAPNSLTSRVVGSTEKYMSKYMQASPAVYLTDRAFGIFESDQDRDPAPAWWNITGNVWDYAKFTASFLPTDMAFGGVTKHGIPLLKAGAEHATKTALVNTGWNSRIKDWMANQLSPHAFKDKLTVGGITGRISATIDAIGQSMSELSNRDPLFFVNKATGVKFEPIKSGIGERAKETAQRMSNRFRLRYRQRMASMHKQAEESYPKNFPMGPLTETQSRDFGPQTQQMETLNQILDPDASKIYGSGADKITQAIAQETLAQYTIPTKSGFLSRVLGLDQAYITKDHPRWKDLQNNYPHIAKGLSKLNVPQHEGATKFFLGSGVFTADGPGGQALIDTHQWRFAALSKQLLQPIEKIKFGLPFFGPKAGIGKIFSAGVHSLIDAFSGPYGRMPKVHKLGEHEGYAIPMPGSATGQVVSGGKNEDAFFMMGQLYRRRGGKLINALRQPDEMDFATGHMTYKSNPYFDESTQTPMLDFTGIDKARHSRISKMNHQLLGLFTQEPETLKAGDGNTWEGVKRWAEVGGFARGLIGNVVDFYTHGFSRQSPRHILGDNSNLGFFQTKISGFKTGKISAKDMSIAIGELDSLFKEGGTASYNVFSRAGVREAFSKSTSGGKPWMTFAVKGRQGELPLKELWNLGDEDLVSASKSLLAGMPSGRKKNWWAKKVTSITSKYEMADFDRTLSETATHYPRSLMGSHKADLTGADELRNFLIHETIYRSQGKAGGSRFNDMVKHLQKKQIIGDREATMLRFTKKGLEWSKINEDVNIIDALEKAKSPGDVPSNPLKWLQEKHQKETFRSFGELYSRFARPRLDRLGDEFTAWGDESTPNVLLARWLPGAKTVRKTFLPKPGEPLTTEGAIPFYLMDRFSSVGHILGMAYDPTRRQTPGQLAGHFMRLSGMAAAAMVGWNTADTFFDVNPMFDKTALGQGLNVAVGDLWAKGRLGVAELYDLTGVTDAAQYMEGLMPGSVTSPLAGMLRGFAAPVIGTTIAGVKGLGIGTLISLLTAGGPAASFGEWDLTKSADDLRSEYSGDSLVPIRKGRWWELGSTPWEGSKIQYFSPHWYQRLRSQYRNTPSQFGGKLEKWLYADWPLIGANPVGYLLDPYHYEREHYMDRPYPESAPMFEEIPFIGPLIAGTLGQMLKPQVNMHPAEVNASFMDGVGWVPNSTAGVGPKFHNTSQKLETGQNFINNSLEMRKRSPQSLQGSRQILGSTFDRAFEQPAGLIGWQTGLLTGGAPFTNGTVTANAGAITSHQRQYWDMQLGGLGGITEFIRRFIPHDIHSREAWNPIRNTQPSWLPGGAENTYHKDFKYGDPYCLEYNTLVESNLQFIPAGEITNEILIDAKGNRTEIVRTATRDKSPTRTITIATLPAFPTTATYDHPYLVRKLVKGRDRSARVELYKIANELLRSSEDGDLKKDIIQKAGYDYFHTYLSNAFKLLEKHKKINSYGRKQPITVLNYEPFDEELLDHGCLFIPAEELSVGDYVAYPKPELYEYINECDLSSIYDWYRIDDEKVYSKNNHSWDRYIGLTPELGFFAGLWCAEGWIQSNSYIGTVHHIDELERAKKAYEDIGLSPNIKEGDGNFVYMGKGNKGLAIFLEWLCGTGARTKILSDVLLSMPKEFVEKFLEGYHFGDGCEFETNRRHRKGHTTASKNLALQIRKLYMCFGIVASVVERKEKPIESELNSSGYINSGPSYSININGQEGPTTWFQDDGFFYFRINKIEEGPEVETYGFMTESSTFCAIGVATHNTKIPMGELRLPGRGYESAHTINFTFPMRASKFGAGHADQVRFFLGMDSPLTRATEDILDRGTALHRAVQQNLARLNLLVQAEAVVYDPYSDISGHVDAIIKDGNRKKVLEIKSTSTEKLSRMVDAQDAHKSQLNLYLKTLGLKEGAILYVDRENPWNMKTFEYGFDYNRYQRDINRLHASRESARQLMREGHGANLGEAYSWLDRARILSDVAPYSIEAKEALVRAQQQIATGSLGPFAHEELEEIKRMRKAVARQFDFYPKRFSSAGDLLLPREQIDLLSENEHMKAASEYNPIARMAGSAWEMLAHRDTWLHRKFLNTYDPIEHYERNVLYNRSTSFWDAPIRDFIEPTLRSMAAEDSPIGGAINWGTTAAMVGSNAFGGMAAIAGAIWGGAHGAYKSVDDSKWIPEPVRKDRKFSEYFDKLQYTKAKRLYEQTGNKDWLTVASETMSGVNPYDQSKDGWTHFYRALPAKERPYMDAFIKETNPDRRNEVVEMVPPAVAEALKAKWNQVDFKRSQRHSDDEAAEEVTDYFRTHHLPKQGWMGWHPMVNMEDVQVKTLDQEGLDAHDFNLGWMDQRRRMARSPFTPGPLNIDETTGESIQPETQLTAAQIKNALQEAIKAMDLEGNVHLTIAPGLLNQTRVTVTTHRNAALTSSINTVHARS
jgi:hypothetical protein